MALAVTAAPASAAGDRFVNVVQVSGWVDPVIVDFLTGAVHDAERTGAEALVIQLDTPGVVVGDDDLGALVETIEDARVPVAVWVGGAGARADGRAGRLVAAAHLAGLAPGARVDAGGRRLGPDEARSAGLADLNEEEAAVLGSFLAALDGREAAGGRLDTATFEEQDDGPPEATLTVQARLAKLELGPRVMHTVASPPVAYLLLAAGLALVLFELFTVGVGIAAGVGVAALVLAAYGLAVLPTSPVGLALVVLGFFGFAVDVQTGVPRFWTAVGVLSFAVGSVLLFDEPARLGWLPLVAGVAGVVVLMLAGLPATVRSRFSTPTIGRDWMIGELGAARTDIDPDGIVTVRDAPWRARTNRATPIPKDAPARVVAIEGLILEVEPEEGGARDYRERARSGE